MCLTPDYRIYGNNNNGGVEIDMDRTPVAHPQSSDDDAFYPRLPFSLALNGSSTDFDLNATPTNDSMGAFGESLRSNGVGDEVVDAGVRNVEPTNSSIGVFGGILRSESFEVDDDEVCEINAFSHAAVTSGSIFSEVSSNNLQETDIKDSRISASEDMRHASHSNLH